jgi:hypothetical protein
VRLEDFGRVVCVCHDSRHPGAFHRVRDLLRAKGVEATAFVNGDAPDRGYDQVNDVPRPAGFVASVGAWNLFRAFVEVVRRAGRDGLDSVLLVEDDLVLVEGFDAVLASVEAPDDWELFYLGANHRFHPTTEAGPNLLRLSGSLMTH